MSEITPPREEDYQALITLIGRIGQQLIELGKQVDDEKLSEKLLDLADQCVGEFFVGVLDTCSRKAKDDAE